MRFIKFLWRDIIKTLQDERGFVVSGAMAALIGAGVLGGGAGFGLSKLRKQPKQQTLGEVRVPQLTDFPTGRNLNEQILAGPREIFTQEDVQRGTSPFIAQREAGFQERERPALEASFGGRGLGRSILAARGVGQAFAQKERDINQILAQAQSERRTLNAAERARMQNLGFNFASREAGLGTAGAQLTQQRNIQQASLNQQFQEAQQKQRDLEIAGTLGGVKQGLSYGAGLGGMIQGGVGGTTQTLSPSNYPTGFEGRMADNSQVWSPSIDPNTNEDFLKKLREILGNQ